MSISIPSAFVAHPAGTSPAFINALPAPDGRATKQCGDSPAALPVETLLTGSEAPKVPEWSAKATNDRVFITAEGQVSDEEPGVMTLRSVSPGTAEEGGPAKQLDLFAEGEPDDFVVVRATGERSDGPPHYFTLRSALAYVRPDGDPATVKERVLVPLARVAREHPDAMVRHSAQSWWSGLYHLAAGAGPDELLPNRGWAEFDVLWGELLCASTGVKQHTLGTVYKDASAAGWPGLTTDTLYTKQELADQWQELRDFDMHSVADLLDSLEQGDKDALEFPEFVEALAHLYQDDPFEYSRVKVLIQQADPTVSLTALDEAVVASFTEEEAA